MQINQDLKVSSHTHSARTAALKEGDIYSALVKERLPQNEAILQIKGQDIKVKFEGEPPKKNQVTVEVMDNHQDFPRVKTIHLPASSASQANPQIDAKMLARQLNGGTPVSIEMQKAVDSLLSKGIPLNKNTFQHIQTFIDKHPGTFDQKLETLSALVKKGLEPTSAHLKAVHQALHDKSFASSIEDLMKEIDPEFRFKAQESMTNSIKSSVHLSEHAQLQRKAAIQRVIEAINQLEKKVIDPKKLEVLQQMKNEIGKKDVNTIVQNLRKSFSLDIIQSPEISSKLVDAIKLENLAKSDSQHQPVKNQSNSQEMFSNQKQTIQQALSKLNQAINQLEKLLVDPKKLQMLQQVKNDIGKKDVTTIAQNVTKLFPLDVMKAPQVSASLSEVINLGRMTETETGVPTQNQSIKDEKAQQIRHQVNVQQEPTSKQSPSVQQIEPQTRDAENSIQKAIQVLKKEPNMNEVFNKLSALLDQHSSLDEKQQKTVATSIQKAEDYVQSGKELGARQELMNTLTRLNQEIPTLQNQQPTITQIENTEAYTMQEDLVASLPIQSKDFIVETVSKKLSQVAIDFKNFKNDLSQSLNTVEQLVQQFKSRSTVTTKPMLETIIKKLDQAILRSDFMLYADMKTEKKLLTASTQLTEAKKLLSKGDYSGATKLVSDVRTVLDKMIFKPSDVRVKHFVSQELGKLDNIPLTKEVTQNFEQSMSALKQEPSARNSFEYLRNLGLTHESDTAQALVAKERNQEALSPSIKSLLLKMTQNDELLQSQKADQVLSNLTGQQLLSKNDATGLQNLMFTLPLLLQDKLENVKVFVNSKNQNEKIDWENCSLFFLFETKKLGEVGIALTSADRTLSVKIKNDQEGFKEKMEPLAELAKQRLGDIGYKIGTIKFEPLNKSENSGTVTSIAQQSHISKMTEKGYDYTV
ncbi:hypothetical protein [Metabacillus halosaccharovorans]|uniref:hypothetical protein n=1 Tax=Metabacillus halosaccharovorans TaxID=930124 RepID=UPI00203EBD17|nr:hypothetical protein [Metabacillus halosaccharovorans]MCM3443763.1 hypothetical protein [Metabacillus halosaccharovorans]